MAAIANNVSKDVLLTCIQELQKVENFKEIADVAANILETMSYYDEDDFTSGNQQMAMLKAAVFAAASLIICLESKKGEASGAFEGSTRTDETLYVALKRAEHFLEKETSDDVKAIVCDIERRSHDPQILNIVDQTELTQIKVKLLNCCSSALGCEGRSTNGKSLDVESAVSGAVSDRGGMANGSQARGASSNPSASTQARTPVDENHGPGDVDSEAGPQDPQATLEQSMSELRIGTQASRPEPNAQEREDSVSSPSNPSEPPSIQQEQRGPFDLVDAAPPPALRSRHFGNAGGRTDAGSSDEESELSQSESVQSIGEPTTTARSVPTVRPHLPTEVVADTNPFLTPSEPSGMSGIRNYLGTDAGADVVDFDDVDPQDKHYDFFIYHESTDVDAARHIKERIERNVRSSAGRASVALLEDFHYEGFPPKPLIAAVKQCTMVAFYVSPTTASKGRGDSILEQLNMLISLSKQHDGGLKAAMVFAFGEITTARTLLERDNDYLKYIVDDGQKYFNVASEANEAFCRKMSDMFKRYRCFTEQRRRPNVARPTDQYYTAVHPVQ